MMLERGSGQESEWFFCLSVDGEGPVLDRDIRLEEIAVCVRKLKNNKTGDSDGLLGELLKYGGLGMIELLHQF